MRLFSAYIRQQDATEANSIFEAQHKVQKIYKDDKPLWELVKKEEVDEGELEKAERDSEINDIEKEEREEIKDIEDLVNQTFKVIRDSVLLIHTQLNELKRLVHEDEVLRDSGFPIEVADQLESMLKSEIVNITAHLYQMGERMQNDNSKTKDSSSVNDQ